MSSINIAIEVLTILKLLDRNRCCILHAILVMFVGLNAPLAMVNSLLGAQDVVTPDGLQAKD